MDNVLDYIKKHNMIKSGEIIGVACSGGRDSISLLHYLNSIKGNLKDYTKEVNVQNLKLTKDYLLASKLTEENNQKSDVINYQTNYYDWNN